MAGFRRGRPETDDGSGAGAAAQPLLSILYPAVTPGDIGAGTLVESSGETVTFTRASVKVLSKDVAETQTVDLANAIPGVSAKGLLMENTRTNGSARCREFDNASWTKQSSTVIADDTTAPDGTATADRLTPTATTGAVLYQGQTGVIGLRYTISVWSRAGTASTLQLGCNTGAGVVFSSPFALTSAWRRCEFQVTSGAAFIYPEVGWDTGATIGQYVHIWGFDSIQSEYRQSGVLTTTVGLTAVRDFCSIPNTKVPVASGRITFNFTPQWSTQPGVAGVLFTTLDASGLHGVALQTTPNAGGAFLSAKTADGTGVAVTSSALTWVAGQTYAIEFTWGSGAVLVKRDGVTVCTSGAVPTVDSHGGSLRLGCIATGNCADGYFSAFAVWAS